MRRSHESSQSLSSSRSTGNYNSYGTPPASAATVFVYCLSFLPSTLAASAACPCATAFVTVHSRPYGPAFLPSPPLAPHVIHSITSSTLILSLATMEQSVRRCSAFPTTLENVKMSRAATRTNMKCCDTSSDTSGEGTSIDPGLHARLLLNLPTSPKKRQRAYIEALVGFVKAHDADNALLVYGMASELDCCYTENVFNAVLSLCEGDKVSHGVRVLADMQEAGIKPRENHYTFLLREAVGRGAFEEAFVQVLDMVEGGVTPRLRSYAPLLAGLCSKPDMPLAWEVWLHMATQGVFPTADEYVGMIKGWAIAGELRQRVVDGSVGELLRGLGDSAFELSFHSLMQRDNDCSSFSPEAAGGSPSQMSEPRVAEDLDGPVSRSDSEKNHLETLLAAFNSEFDFASNSPFHTNGHEDRRGGKSSPTSPSSSPPQIPMPIPAARIATASVDGVCDCCGARLAVVGLDSPARAQVRSALKMIAGSERDRRGVYPAESSAPVQAGPAAGATSTAAAVAVTAAERKETTEIWAGNVPGNVGVEGEAAKGELGQFAVWLDERRRRGLHFTTVVDGCNVAYFRQNKEGGRFQISQIGLVVDLLEAQGENPLVVLPERYLREIVPNSSRHKGVKNPPSRLTTGERGIISGWVERGMLYSCADGADDDIFWMYFTVSADDTDTANATLETVPDVAAVPSSGTLPRTTSVGVTSALEKDDVMDALESEVRKKTTDGSTRRQEGDFEAQCRDGEGSTDVRRSSGDALGSGDGVKASIGGGTPKGVYGKSAGGNEGRGVVESRRDGRAPEVRRIDGNVSEGGEAGRYRAGGSTRRLTVVSNDEMRNHRMALLEPVPFMRWRKSQVRAFHVPAWTTPHDQGLATLDTSCPDANASGRNGAESDGIEFDGNFTKGRDIAVKDIDDDRVRPGHVNIETTDRKVGAQTSDKQGERTRAMDDSRREGLDESKASSSSVWSPPPQPPSQRVLPPSSTSGAQPWLQPAVCPPPRFTRDMQVVRRAWHVPIGGDSIFGDSGTKWLCVNLEGFYDEKGVVDEEDENESHAAEDIAR